MASELQQLGTFLGAKFDDIYDGVVAVGNAALVNGQTADQIKTAVINLLRDGVVAEGDTLFKLNQKIAALQALVASDDFNLDTVQEIVEYIKNNSNLIDSIMTLKANLADVYTQAVMDDMLLLKADAESVYTKAQTYSRSEIDIKDSLKSDTTYVDVELAKKVNFTDVLGTINVDNKVMTQSDVATAIAGKADSTDVNAALDTKASIVYTDGELVKKVNFTDVLGVVAIDNKVMTESDVATAISPKADTSYVDGQDALAVKYTDTLSGVTGSNKVMTQSDVATAISPKANTADVNTALALKVNYTDTVSAVTAENKVVTQAELSSGLSLKADKATTYTKTEVDAKESALNTVDQGLQSQITQIGNYSEFVAAFAAALA
jgi:hypothetical protein